MRSIDTMRRAYILATRYETTMMMHGDPTARASVAKTKEAVVDMSSKIKTWNDIVRVFAENNYDRTCAFFPESEEEFALYKKLSAQGLMRFYATEMWVLTEFGMAQAAKSSR